MTWQAQPNLDDTLFRSGERGYGGYTHNRQPDFITTVSSGSGSVTFDDSGMVVDAGSATGDTASVTGASSNSIRRGGHIVEFVFGLTHSTPFTNTFKIGYLQSGGQYNSFYYSPTTEEFVYERGSNNRRDAKPATSISDLCMSYLRLHIQGDICDFRLETNAGVSEARVTEQAPIQPNQLIYSSHNGGNEGMKVMWLRHTYYPE